jgi:hypothetical protein
MMRIKQFVAAFALALALTAVYAGGAYAGGLINFGAGLELTEQGAPATLGATIENEVNFGPSCLDASLGKLLNNGGLADVLQFGPPSYINCEPYTVTGGVTYVALSDTGVAGMLANITLTSPGPCTYAVSVLTGTFRIGAPYGFVDISGNATGWLNRSKSSASCANELHTEYSAGDLDTEYNHLGTELTKSHF